MSRIQIVRIVLVLLVAAALAAPPAWSQPAERPDGFAARIAGAFASFGDFLAALWAEEGCILDPHGGCSGDTEGGDEASGATTQGEEGCIIDPHGGCRG